MTWAERSAPSSSSHPFTRARMEAMQLLDMCLIEGTLHPIEAFLEAYLVQDPPPLTLLTQIADDIEARRRHLHAERLNSNSTNTLNLLTQITDYLDDWICGVATRVAQRAAFQRGTVVTLPLPDERTH